MTKFETTGTVSNHLTPLRQRIATSTENMVCESVQENQRQSIDRREQGLSQALTWRILHQDLSLYSYKIQLTQELYVNDHIQHRLFAD